MVLGKRWTGNGLANGFTITTTAQANTVGNDEGTGAVVIRATSGTPVSIVTEGDGVRIIAGSAHIARIDSGVSQIAGLGGRFQVFFTAGGVQASGVELLLNVKSTAGDMMRWAFLATRVLRLQNAAGSSVGTVPPACIDGHRYQMDVIAQVKETGATTGNGRLVGRIKDLDDPTWNGTGDWYWDSGETLNLGTAAFAATQAVRYGKQVTATPTPAAGHLFQWMGWLEVSLPPGVTARADVEAYFLDSPYAVPAEGGFAAAYAWGPAAVDGASPREGGFTGAYGWGPATAVGSNDPEGGFSGAYAWGPAAVDGSTTREGGFAASLAWGPAVADGSTAVEGGFASAYGWGPASFDGSVENAGGFTTAYSWGPAGFIPGAGEAAGGFASAYGWGPTAAAGSAGAEGGFAAAYSWGPAEVDGSAQDRGGFVASYGWGPADAGGSADYEGGFGTAYAWGVAEVGGSAPSTGGFSASLWWGPATAAGSLGDEYCWPNPLSLVPLGPVVDLDAEGDTLALVPEGPQVSLDAEGSGVTLIPMGPQVSLSPLGPLVGLVPLGPVLGILVEEPC